MSDESEQLAVWWESSQLLGVHGDSQATMSWQQLTVKSNDMEKYFTHMDTKLTSLIRKSGLREEAVELEYKRAVTEIKEVYQHALSRKPNEHSNSF